MKKFNWSYTQFSQFNADDSLLLVSGVFMGPRTSSSGEIAVISLGKDWKSGQVVEGAKAPSLFGAVTYNTTPGRKVETSSCV